MSENRALNRISGSKRVETTGGWRKIHDGELNNAYRSSDIIRTLKSKKERKKERKKDWRAM
jgi:hypothetical protein